MNTRELLSHIDTPYHFIIILFLTSISSFIIGVIEPDLLLKFVGVAVFFLTMILASGYYHNKPKEKSVSHD